MNTMRDSGVDWIGKIPRDWELKRIQFCLNEISIKNNPPQTEQVLSLVKNKGVMLYEEKGNQGNKAKENLTEYKLAYPNTLVVNSMNILIGSVGISKYFGCVSPVYYVFEETELCDLEYINYIFNTNEFQKELRKYANGILEIRLRVSALNIFKRKIPLPPKSEQQKISKYLNIKVKNIDDRISKLNNLIEKYKEYKQSLISEVVTKGLNSDVEMKDSGVEWIGEIPKHWITIYLKYASWLKGRIGWQGLRASEFVNEGPYLITGTDFDNGIINWDTCVHITEERFYQDSAIHIKEGDLLITKDGTIGKVAIAINCPEKVSLNSGVFIIRNNRKYKYYGRFIYHLLQSEQFTKWFDLSNTGNSTIKHLTQEQFYNFQFSYPPLDEQKQIAEYLDEKCEHIDSIIIEKEKLIVKLEEYKKSLIYEYVTGKKEVPDEI